MAKRVKLSAIAAEIITTPFEEGMERAVQKMMAHWDKELSNVLCDNPDLVVLPEVCDRFVNFTPEQRLKYYDYRGNTFLNYFAEKAKEHRCYIAYPHVRTREDGMRSNCLKMLGRDGHVVGTYDKYHMTIQEIEALNGRCGDEAVIFDCDFGRVGAAICFDLNFPQILQLYKEKKPEIMLFPSMYHGSFMQNFWAYGLRSYFVSAVAGLESAIINPVGEKITRSTNYFKYITENINLDYQVVHLDYNLKALAAAREKYGSKVKVFDPGYLGAVLITSETDEFTVGDIIDEFGIKLLDEYFEESIAVQGRTREIF